MARAIASKNGRFGFDEVPRGKYVIRMISPTDGFTNVELVKPEKGENDTVAIKYFAESCMSASVVSADGRTLMRGG